VAVRTQDTNVLNLVVCRVSIDVMKLKWNGLPVPFGETADFAPSFLIAGGEQAILEFAALVRRVDLQYLLESTRGHHGLA
jgi:hypothetical protein